MTTMTFMYGPANRKWANKPTFSMPFGVDTDSAMDEASVAVRR